MLLDSLDLGLVPFTVLAAPEAEKRGKRRLQVVKVEDLLAGSGGETREQRVVHGVLPAPKLEL